jgi:hypothetical protein
LEGLVQVQVVDIQIYDFLHARTSVEHYGNEDVVTQAVGSASINTVKYGTDFVIFKVIDRASCSSLEGYPENSLRLFDSLWRMYSNVSKEGMNGR